jgi:hypothetical protein
MGWQVCEDLAVLDQDQTLKVFNGLLNVMQDGNHCKRSFVAKNQNGFK